MTHTDRGHALIPGSSPAAIFDALLDPGARVEWLPPSGMSGTFEWFDARPGCGYRMVLSYDDGETAGKSGGNTDVGQH